METSSKRPLLRRMASRQTSTAPSLLPPHPMPRMNPSPHTLKRRWPFPAMSARLLSQLNEKEREYQELLRNSVQRKQKQIDALKSAAVTEDGLASQKSSNPEVKAVVHWLKSVPVDQDTIDKLLSHEFTLDCLLYMASRDDLMYCGIRGGMLCRIWAAITARRKNQLSTHNEDSEDTLL